MYPSQSCKSNNKCASAEPCASLTRDTRSYKLEMHRSVATEVLEVQNWGSNLGNTEYIVGAVIFTGHETKVPQFTYVVQIALIYLLFIYLVELFFISDKCCLECPFADGISLT
ncbi:uncharacterized protein [Primulina eburnea]|uniref:uncharacterized protein n=1 Tax=Primulina eburnea TaxID=1245227 RepID=UPI003C6C5047